MSGALAPGASVPPSFGVVRTPSEVVCGLNPIRGGSAVSRINVREHKPLFIKYTLLLILLICCFGHW